MAISNPFAFTFHTSLTWVPPWGTELTTMDLEVKAEWFPGYHDTRPLWAQDTPSEAPWVDIYKVVEEPTGLDMTILLTGDAWTDLTDRALEEAQEAMDCAAWDAADAAHDEAKERRWEEGQ